MPWDDYPTESITIPATAGGADPRIYVGQGDPLLNFLGNNAGIVYYTGLLRAFINGVADFPPSEFWNLQYLDFNNALLVNLINAEIDQSSPIISQIEFFNSPNTGGERIKYGRPIPKGAYDFDVDYHTADTAAIGAETTVFSLGPLGFEIGRAYKISIRGYVYGSVVNDAHFKLKRGLTPAGSLIQEMGRWGTKVGGGAAQMIYGEAIVINDTTSVVSSSINVTLTASAGTVTMAGNASWVRYMRVIDIGASEEWPEGTQI